MILTIMLCWQFSSVPEGRHDCNNNVLLAVFFSPGGTSWL